MKRFRFSQVLRFVLFTTLFVGVMGFAVMSLWNLTLPLLVRGVSAITFWQAIALLVLSRLLFGGFRGPWNRTDFGTFKRDQWKGRMAEHWQKLTPEQRDRMRQFWGNRCRPDRSTPPTDSTDAS
ncbi:hypothetical protein [Spirosoma rhododendri]|uniref:hypothetical protein n=1 Tax=Spirosoma rhododendri TaxID=2728024 RepID=UPI001583BF66|nr:hypothetical protein [Spirosoma rhododendri]